MRVFAFGSLGVVGILEASHDSLFCLAKRRLPLLIDPKFLLLRRGVVALVIYIVVVGGEVYIR